MQQEEKPPYLRKCEPSGIVLVNPSGGIKSPFALIGGVSNLERRLTRILFRLSARCGREASAEARVAWRHVCAAFAYS